MAAVAELAVTLTLTASHPHPPPTPTSPTLPSPRSALASARRTTAGRLDPLAALPCAQPSSRRLRQRPDGQSPSGSDKRDARPRPEPDCLPQRGPHTYRSERLTRRPELSQRMGPRALRPLPSIWRLPLGTPTQVPDWLLPWSISSSGPPPRPSPSPSPHSARSDS